MKYVLRYNTIEHDMIQWMYGQYIVIYVTYENWSVKCYKFFITQALFDFMASISIYVLNIVFMNMYIYTYV